MPDTDAIDYDGITNGIIKNCYIYNFHGSNSDAIDIGEQAENVLIDNVFVRSVTDKGVSVGQHSSATIQNSTFVGCNLGLGLKDSCNVFVNNCNFYGNAYAIACYEKNLGSAGGNAQVLNSILTNCSESPVLLDDKSMLAINNSISDKDDLTALGDNIYGNPYFMLPDIGDFYFADNSPCLFSGNIISVNGHIGNQVKRNYQPNVIITSFYINPTQGNMPQFIEVTNLSGASVDMGGYEINKGVTAKVPEYITLFSGNRIYFTNNASHEFWAGKKEYVIQWEKGTLSLNGESIQLVNAQQMVVDYLDYDEYDNWPVLPFVFDNVFVLNDTLKDNSFGENWIGRDYLYAPSASVAKKSDRFVFDVYPTYTHDFVTVKTDRGGEVLVYSLLGIQLDAYTVFEDAVLQINAGQYAHDELVIFYQGISKLIFVGASQYSQR